MSTTNDTRPEMEPGFNWETYARQLEVKQDALHAELRAADAAIGARTKVFYAELAAERAIKAELVAALEMVSLEYDTLLDRDHGWERAISNQCTVALNRAKEASK